MSFSKKQAAPRSIIWDVEGARLAVGGWRTEEFVKVDWYWNLLPLLAHAMFRGYKGPVYQKTEEYQKRDLLCGEWYFVVDGRDALSMLNRISRFFNGNGMYDAELYADVARLAHDPLLGEVEGVCKTPAEFEEKKKAYRHTLSHLFAALNLRSFRSEFDQNIADLLRKKGADPEVITKVIPEALRENIVHYPALSQLRNETQRRLERAIEIGLYPPSKEAFETFREFKRMARRSDPLVPFQLVRGGLEIPPVL